MIHTVRDATLDDYDTVESLFLELNRHHVDVEPTLIRPVDVYLARDAYEQVIRDPRQTILLLLDDQTVVAAAWLIERRHEGGQAIEMPVAFIRELCTRKSHRRRGYGRRMMRAIERWARERRAARIEFNVWAGNSGAIAFYESLGYGFMRHEMYKALG